MHAVPPSLCYTEKATDAWHCQGGQHHNTTNKSYDQAKLLSTGTTHDLIAVAGLNCTIKPLNPAETHQHSNPARKPHHLALFLCIALHHLAFCRACAPYISHVCVL